MIKYPSIIFMCHCLLLIFFDHTCVTLLLLERLIMKTYVIDSNIYMLVAQSGKGVNIFVYYHY